MSKFDLSPLGLGVVPATGKAFDTPPGTSRVSFDNGKISKMYGLDTGPDVGMAGLLKALDVELG